MKARPQRLLAATVTCLVAASSAIPALASAPAGAATGAISATTGTGSFSVATYNIRHALSDEVATRDTAQLADAGVDVIALQEMSSRMRRNAIAARLVSCSACPMDAFMPTGSGQAALPILFRTSVFELLDTGTRMVSERTYVGPQGAGPSTMPPKYLTYVHLRHRVSGQDIYVINNHAVPSVQASDGGPNYGNPERLRLFRQHMEGLANLITQFKATGGAVIATGDFNVNYRRDVVVRDRMFPYFNMDLLGMHASYKFLGTPAQGTHRLSGSSNDTRIIDYVASVDNANLVPQSQEILMGYTSDHRPVVVRYGVAAGSGPAPGSGSGTLPGSPSRVRAAAAERAARVSWAAAPGNGTAVTGYKVTAFKTTSTRGRVQAATVNSGTTSAVVTGLERGARYIFTVRATNRVGSGPESPVSNAVTPFAVRPETTITRGPANRSFVTSREVALAYGSRATGPSFMCSLDGRARPCGGSGTTLSALTSRTHTFRVAARDSDGDVDASPATRTWTVPRDDFALRRTAAWSRRQAPGYFSGTYSQSSRRGSVLSSHVTRARSLALVASRGPRFGTVRVFLGHRPLRRISLGSRVLSKQRVIPVVKFRRPRTGRVRVVVVSRHRTVRVEGLGVATR